MTDLGEAKHQALAAWSKQWVAELSDAELANGITVLESRVKLGRAEKMRLGQLRREIERRKRGGD